jgi:hypothetical protein
MILGACCAKEGLNISFHVQCFVNEASPIVLEDVISCNPGIA